MPVLWAKAEEFQGSRDKESLIKFVDKHLASLEKSRRATSSPKSRNTHLDFGSAADALGHFLGPSKWL